MPAPINFNASNPFPRITAGEVTSITINLTPDKWKEHREKAARSIAEADDQGWHSLSGGEQFDLYRHAEAAMHALGFRRAEGATG